MGILEINLISLSLSLIIGFFSNAILNGALGFLRDNASMFNRYNLFQVMLPTYLFTTSLLSLMFNNTHLLARVIHFASLVYFAFILFSINTGIIKRKRLNRYKIYLRQEIIDPWISGLNLINARCSINLYVVGSDIKGEVIITLLNGETIPEESITQLRNQLSSKNISLHIRNSPIPRNAKFG